MEEERVKEVMKNLRIVQIMDALAFLSGVVGTVLIFVNVMGIGKQPRLEHEPGTGTLHLAETAELKSMVHVTHVKFNVTITITSHAILLKL